MAGCRLQIQVIPSLHQHPPGCSRLEVLVWGSSSQSQHPWML